MGVLVSLNPVSARLRVINKSNAVAKVQVAVPAGEVLEVSAEFASALFAASPAFVEVPSAPVDVQVSLDGEAIAKRGPGRPRKNADA